MIGGMPAARPLSRLCAAALVLQAVCMTAFASEARSTPALDPEVAKQRSIYDSRGQQVPQGYVIDRSLLSYAFVLSAEF